MVIANSPFFIGNYESDSCVCPLTYRQCFSKIVPLFTGIITIRNL